MRGTWKELFPLFNQEIQGLKSEGWLFLNKKASLGLGELVVCHWFSFWILCSFSETIVVCCSNTKSSLTVFDLMDCNTPGSSVLHYLQGLLKFMSIELEVLSNHLILCCSFFSCPQSFPALGSLPKSWLFASGGQSIRTSASVSVLVMNVQCWFPLALIGLILESKRLLRVFSRTTI